MRTVATVDVHSYHGPVTPSAVSRTATGRAGGLSRLDARRRVERASACARPGGSDTSPGWCGRLQRAGAGISSLLVLRTRVMAALVCLTVASGRWIEGDRSDDLGVLAGLMFGA